MRIKNIYIVFWRNSIFKTLRKILEKSSPVHLKHIKYIIFSLVFSIFFFCSSRIFLTCKFFILFIDSFYKEEREKEKKNIDMSYLFMYSLVDSWMCPGWGSNAKPWLYPTELHCQGYHLFAWIQKEYLFILSMALEQNFFWIYRDRTKRSSHLQRV